MGKCGELNMTLVNKSHLDSIVFLDLRENEEYDGVDCLEIQNLNDNFDEESAILEEIDDEEENEENKNSEEEFFDAGLFILIKKKIF